VDSSSVGQDKFTLLVLGIFAIVALSLAAVGVYGVIAYAVGERRREIGVRIALGAAPSGVATSVVMRGVRYALIGVVIGLAGAFAITRVMRSLLFEVSTTDPLTFVGLSALLVAVASVASYLPARSAARTDPMIALRSDE
jgi:ABC-type antimicrobial peptide transport system permease subunit